MYVNIDDRDDVDNDISASIHLISCCFHRSTTVFSRFIFLVIVVVFVGFINITPSRILRLLHSGRWQKVHIDINRMKRTNAKIAIKQIETVQIWHQSIVFNLQWNIIIAARM